MKKTWRLISNLIQRIARHRRFPLIGLILIAGAAPWRKAQNTQAAAAFATFTVTNTNDSGAGSLRQAILEANANPGADVIEFNILPGGAQTIAPASALPTIAGPLAIDGTTQPGYSGAPIIELNGASAGSGTNGLGINALGR